MTAEFAPILLTLLDTFTIALEFLLVSQSVDLLDEEVNGSFILNVHFHHFGEVLLDVQQDVHFFVLLPGFQVEGCVLVVDEVSYFVACVFDVVHNEGPVNLVQFFCGFGGFLKGHFEGGPIDYFLFVGIVHDVDVDADFCGFKHSLLDLVGPIVMVLQVEGDFLL